MAVPEFLEFTCISSPEDICLQCPRKFAIAVSSIRMIFKNGGGKAVLDTGDHYTHHQLCGERLKIIRTSQNYEEFLVILGKKVYNMGDAEMVYYVDTL